MNLVAEFLMIVGASGLAYLFGRVGAAREFRPLIAEVTETFSRDLEALNERSERSIASLEAAYEDRVKIDAETIAVQRSAIKAMRSQIYALQMMGDPDYMALTEDD